MEGHLASDRQACLTRFKKPATCATSYAGSGAASQAWSEAPLTHRIRRTGVEQVRQGLCLGSDDFYLYGRSWGGILAMECVLKCPDNRKGMIISNIVASMPACDR